MALPRKFKPRDLTISSELKTLYGRPVVTSENRAAYDRMLLGLIECLDPKDCMERSLVKDIATNTWEIARYTRHMALVPERKFQQLRERLMDEAIEIADDTAGDWVEMVRPGGRVVTVRDPQHLARCRLRLDVRHWVADRIAPAKPRHSHGNPKTQSES